MVVKTFRGLLADGGQDRIRLSTIKGKVGYQITKFQLMPYVYGAGSGELESVVKIYKSSTTPSEHIDFTDSNLLGAAIINNASNANQYPSVLATVFDNEIVNQDIYVTHKNQHADAASVSYYIELEVIPLDDAGAEYTTLKDMRQT